MAPGRERVKRHARFCPRRNFFVDIGEPLDRVRLIAILSLSLSLSLSLLPFLFLCLDLGETESKRMSPTDSTHVMLVTRRPILTSVEENGTFVPSKTRIGSGRIVPRIDESRAISFCLPPASGTTSRAIREIDRLSNGYARLYPFHLSCLSSPFSSSSSSYPASYSTFRLYILVAFRFSHGTDGDLLSLSLSLSLYLLSFYLFLAASRFVKHLFGTINATSFRLVRGQRARIHIPGRHTYRNVSRTLCFPRSPSSSPLFLRFQQAR